MFIEILATYYEKDMVGSELVDSDFIEHMGSFYRPAFDDSYLPAFWDKIVEIYEAQTLNVGKNIFVALKKLEWFDAKGQQNPTYNLEWLFNNSKKLNAYRNEIEKYLMLV